MTHPWWVVGVQKSDGSSATSHLYPLFCPYFELGACWLFKDLYMQPSFRPTWVTVCSSTIARVLFLQKQTELYPNQPKHELKMLSDTCWVCRYAAIDTMCHTFSALIATLEEIVHSDDREKAVQPSGLLFQVKSFIFFLLLIINPWCFYSSRTCANVHVTIRYVCAAPAQKNNTAI